MAVIWVKYEKAQPFGLPTVWVVWVKYRHLGSFQNNNSWVCPYFTQPFLSWNNPAFAIPTNEWNTPGKQGRRHHSCFLMCKSSEILHASQEAKRAVKFFPPILGRTPGAVQRAEANTTLSTALCTQPNDDISPSTALEPWTARTEPCHTSTRRHCGGKPGLVCHAETTL